MTPTVFKVPLDLNEIEEKMYYNFEIEKKIMLI